MAEEKQYTILNEAHDMIKKLKERYPKIMWAVVPEELIVLGVTNKERPKTMRKLATISRLKPSIRTIIQHVGRNDVKYYIEVYCSDWQNWATPRRSAIIMHELAHVPGPDEAGLIQHDLEDFAFMIDGLGVDWSGKEGLPNLLEGDPFPFKEELATRLHVKPEYKDDSEGGE